MKNFLKIAIDLDVAVEVLENNLKFGISKTRKTDTRPFSFEGMLFGYVFSGSAKLTHKNESEVKLVQGMYFAVDSDWTLVPTGNVLTISIDAYKGLSMFGGPIEKNGRLSYIDNCTDSLLIPPTKLGDPCLNLLVFPSGVKQTPHTHPSFRAGIVVSGSGTCELGSQSEPLMPGDFFLIPDNLRHSFFSGSDGLRVIAFHPDSDYGPTDKVHPMINRTIIEKTNE